MEASIDAMEWLVLRLKAYLSAETEGQLMRRAVCAFPVGRLANHEMWCPKCRGTRWFEVIASEKRVAGIDTLTVIRGVPAHRCLTCRQVFGDVQLGALLEEEADCLPGGEVEWETLLQPKGPAAVSLPRRVW